MHDIFQFNPGKIQVRFRPGQTEKVQNFVSYEGQPFLALAHT